MHTMHYCSALHSPSAHMSAFEVLGVTPDTNEAGIKHAYRRRSLEWHPDRWARYSDAYVARANYLFSLVTSAYQQIAPSREESDEDESKQGQGEQGSESRKQQGKRQGKRQGKHRGKRRGTASSSNTGGKTTTKGQEKRRRG